MMLLAIYLVGMIGMALFLAKPLISTLVEPKTNHGAATAVAIYVAGVILWPLTVLFVLFVLWIGSMLPPTF